MSVFTFCSIDRKNFYMKSLTQGLNPRILCLLHWQTGSLLVMPNILCGPKSEVLFYHHVVRKWSPITQIWTYLSEGTASQISKHLVYALGAVHPFQDMPLDSMESKIVIFSEGTTEEQKQRYDLGSLMVRSFVFIQNATPILFLSCNFSKETSRNQEDFFFVCLFNLIGGNYNIVLVFDIHQHELAQVYMCPPFPEHPLLLPLYSVYPSCPRTLSFGALLNASICTGHIFYIWPWHVSILFSQIIPLSLSPTEYKGLFFTSMSLLLPCM